MASFAQGLTNDERTAIASLVTGKVAEAPHATADKSGQCAQNEAGFPQAIGGPQWNGWGADLNNSRFQLAAMAGIAPDQVSRRRLKWAFGFPLTTNANAQPTVVGGLLFVGGGDSKVRALCHAKSGCTRWAFPTEAPVRTAISFAPLDNDQFAIFFGDVRANVYAVNAMTGALIWKSKVDDHPAARSHWFTNRLFRRCLCRGFHRSRRSRGLAPPTNAARFAAASSRCRPRPARRSGRPIPSPKRRIPQSRMPSEPSSLVRPERRYGPHRRSMFSARRSMSRLRTAIPTRRQTPAMPSSRLILRPAG